MYTDKGFQMPGKILICGDRNWTNEETITRAIDILVEKYGEDIAIIEGGAPGVDSIAGRESIKRSLVTVIVPAKWHLLGKRAGPQRNEYMLNKCKPNLVLGFHHNVEDSKGTKHMLDIAIKANVPTFHIKTRKHLEEIVNELPEVLGG